MALSAIAAAPDCSRSRVEGRSSVLVTVRMRGAGAAAGRQRPDLRRRLLRGRRGVLDLCSRGSRSGLPHSAVGGKLCVRAGVHVRIGAQHREAELRRVRVRPEQRLAERRMRSPCGVSPVLLCTLPRSAPLDVRRRGPWSLRLTDRLHRNGRVRVASRLMGPVGLVDVLWCHSHQSPSRRPEQRYQLQWPVRVHLCGGGAIKATDGGGNGARAASGAWETGAPASLLERLLPPQPGPPGFRLLNVPSFFPISPDQRRAVWRVTRA
jgi:hypothetical protein